MTFRNLPLSTDGPERFKGGHVCLDHHLGVREDISDWCCCCNPCLYTRNPEAVATKPVSPWETRGLCCRCLPLMICMTFTPTNPEPGSCCARGTYIGWVTFPGVGLVTARYEFEFVAGEPIYINIESSMEGENMSGPCAWTFVWEAQGINESYPIDHVTRTCLKPPEISVASVVDLQGCVGSLSFQVYEGDKIPFVNTQLENPPDLEVPYSPCNCETVPKYLCVSGVRHVNGDTESVRFVWNEDLGDRWEYLPACGNLLNDREIIYLRGDHDNNCYLELDFEASGPDTNDWADPPNSLGEDPLEVRPGLIHIEGCGTCGFFVQSETSGGRFISITSGPCGRWRYGCGTCRCVPRTLCVFGNLEGQVINNVSFVWDSDRGGWHADLGGVIGNFSLGLAEGPTCPPPNDTRIDDECVGTGGGNLTVPLANGTTPVICGPFVNFELASKFNPAFPDVHNWLWASTGLCGCVPQRCFICSEERCGGPPSILYLDLIGTSYEDMALPGSYTSQCNLSITMFYWQRWTRVLNAPPVLSCGYIGQTIVSCYDTSYLFTAYTDESSQLFITKKDLNTGVTVLIQFSGTVISPYSCDPFVFQTGVANGGAFCTWRCDEPKTGRDWEVYLTLVE